MLFSFKFLCVVVVLVSASMDVFAQAGFSIHGTIVDGTGSAVPAAPVQLLTAAGTSAGSTVSTITGEFQLAGIAAGSYKLNVAATSGFAAQSIPVRVTGSINPLKIKLALETVTQTVDVGEDSVLSASGSANKDAVTISGSDLQRLPVFDQDYVGALLPFLDPGSGSSGGVTIMVDGVEMKGSTVSPSAIAEVRINNDPYSAEFSRPGRGRIDIITKPGSPEFHGELNFIARNAVFNAKNFFAPSKPPEQREIYEGHLTGPVGHGAHTTFLISGDRRVEDTAVAVHAVGVQGPMDENVPTPRRESQLTGRVTHDFSAAHRLSLGYNFEFGTRENSGVGGIVLAEAGVHTASREDDLIFNDRIIITPNLLNQLLITLEKDEDNSRSVTDSASVQVQDALIGGGAQADVHRTENTIHINEILSWTHKKHYIRFGANLPQLSRRAVDDHTNRLGTSKYNTLADYSAANAYVFTQQTGPGRGLYCINEVAGFIQDEIKVRKNLQVTLGLRYQWQTYMNSTKNFAPRLSAAYFFDKKTILRAGAGIFFDRTGGDFPATFKLHDGVVLRSIQVLPGQSAAAVPSSIVRMDPRARSPYAIQYSFAVERQFAHGITMTAGYRGITGVSNFRSRDANAVLPANYATLVRPDPNFGVIQQIESSGRLSSNALDVSFRSRAGRWFNGQAQYTLGRVYTNTNGISSYSQDQYNPNNEWGRADIDRLHRFNLLGNVNPDHWLTLGISATMYSGAPYTELAGVDTFHTGLGNARPVGVGRDTLQGGGTADVDLLWDHDVKVNKATGDHAKVLNFGVSAFNVLNHANYTSYVGTVTSPLFRQPIAALAGRQMQFGVRYQF